MSPLNEQLTRITRREALGMLSAAAASAVAACGNSPTSPTSTTTPAAATGAACAVSPSETIGPYPSLTDLIRSDIREGKSGPRSR